MTSPADAFDLTGKTALITGSTRGLGRETAQAFAEAGADIMVVSRKRSACEEVAGELEESTGRRAVPFACHLGTWEEVDGLAAAARESFDRIDVLVNNAGVSPVYDRVEDISEALWRKVIDVNLTGPFRLSALVGSQMVADGGGAIINVSSIAASVPSAAVIPYAAAKAGLNALTGGLARAFGPTVRVNGVMAGTFMTDISKSWDLDRFEQQAQTFALRRGGEPREIVGTMLYLASDASSYTTGSTVVVDGGYTQNADDLPAC
jgi:NAD(P)-dependent dehydrogenase (short-subunit alcohol dehydrogenase family)